MERRHLSGSMSLRQDGAGSVCVTGSREQTTNAMALEREPKQTILGQKGFGCHGGAPFSTQALRLCTGHAGAEEGRRGGDEGWKIKRDKRKPEKG